MYKIRGREHPHKSVLSSAMYTSGNGAFTDAELIKNNDMRTVSSKNQSIQFWASTGEYRTIFKAAEVCTAS